MAVACGIILVLVTFVSFLGPLFLSQSYYAQDLQLGAAPPSAAHWLGTDTLGRDLFVRILYGGQVSMSVGLCATAVALTIGVFYGTVSGFIGGKWDALMMRIVDIIYALPFTVFVILLMVFFGRKFVLLFVAIGAVQWLTMARIVRGQVQTLRRQEFIEAAEALGLTKLRIIFRHMIPNAIGPIIVYATLTVPAVMLLEAFLSFLGLGVQPPMSSWGVLIKEGADSMEEFPWLLIFPDWRSHSHSSRSIFSATVCAMRSMYEQRKIKKTASVMLSIAKHLSNDRRPSERSLAFARDDRRDCLRHAIDTREAKI